MQILVTGGAGFIGSHITEELLKQGNRVRVLDNLSTGFLTNVSSFFNNPNFEFMYGDITDVDVCRRACRGINAICHQAALGSVPRSIDDPLTSHRSNVNGFINMLSAAREAGIKRIVYASSSSVYGSNDDGIKQEDRTGRLLSPYAATKFIDEIYGQIFTDVYKMELIGLRYFNVFGPRQNPNGCYAAVIPKFIQRAINNERLTINGDGSCSRDFTFIDNVVYANLLALFTTNAASFGTAFNVGTTNPISVDYMAKSICQKLGKPFELIEYGPVRMGDIHNSNASTEKIQTMLGYKPLVLFDEGLNRTILYFLQK